MKRRISPRKQAGGLLTASPFLLPSLIGMLIFSVLPLIISGMISLTDWNGLAKLTDPGFLQEHFIGLENYKKILTSTEFWRTLGNTAEYIFLYIPLMLAASLLVATLLSQARRGIGFFRVVYYIPVLTSWVAASLIWKSVLSPQYGALNGILSIFGIQGPGWLTDEKWAMPAIVLVSVWKDMGFPLLIVHILFRAYSSIPWFEAKWSAGNVLAYIAGFEALLGTVILGLITVTQSEKANEVNERLARENNHLQKISIQPLLEQIS